MKSPDDVSPVGPRGRWAQRMENQGIIMKSMLDENSAIQLSLADCMGRTSNNKLYNIQSALALIQLPSLKSEKDRPLR